MCIFDLRHARRRGASAPREPLGRPLLSALVALVLCAIPAAHGQSTTQDAQDQTDYPLKHDARDRYDRVQFMNSASNQLPLNAVPRDADSFFFPPVPPRLGTDILPLAPPKPGAPAPPELADYVNEFFYPVLGSRLRSDDISKSLWARLRAYRTQKLALQGELRVQIAGLTGLDSRSAEEKMAAFAAVQTPKVRALEETAEGLRMTMRHTGLLSALSNDVDWDELRPWRFKQVRDKPPTQTDLERESELLRGAAYYQAGFSVAQRELLREAAAEVAESSDGHVTAIVGSVLHFSPELTRIRLPDELPAEVRSRIDAYVASKGNLIDELRGQVKDRDELNAVEREHAFSALAAQEAPVFAGLEASAEAVRRALAAIPFNSGPPSPPALSPELTARITAYRERKRAVLEKIRAMLVAPEPAPGIQSWERDGTTSTVVRPVDIRGSVDDFERAQKALLTPLNEEQASIRKALADYVRSNNGPADRKSVNDLLRDFEDARQKQEIWDKYRDYRSAALLPGMSPEQRRLLFDAALEELDLPLPNGERVR